MKSRQSLVAVVSALVLFGAVTIGFFISIVVNQNDKAEPEATLSSMVVNPHAKVSAQGYPLPSDAKEDVAISVTDTGSESGYSSGKVLYDYDTGEWEVALTDELGLINMVFADDQHYVFDTDNEDWFRISSAEAEDVFDINAIYFDESVVEGFLASASFINESECGAGLCSAWQIVLGTEEADGGEESVDTLTIRVENGSRKIYDINALGENTSFTLIYTYQEVDIEPPSSIADDPNIEIINLDENNQPIETAE